MGVEKSDMKIHETTTMVGSNPTIKREQETGLDIHIAEMFGDTIQGEGKYTGHPALFLRVQGCTLSCVFCDSAAVWRFGNPYTADEVLMMWESNGYIEKFKAGHHLILTGGSPMKQQLALVNLIERFRHVYKFKPFIEVENECTLMPSPKMLALVDHWNNSPKLSNSGNGGRRYNKRVLKVLGELNNSTFKFVVSSEEDWKEIKEGFLDTGLVTRDQIMLMPCGATQEELKETPHVAVAIAVREGVRYSDRVHVRIWDKMTGV